MLITLFAGLFVFGVLVFIHELGHFMAAKAFKVAVEEFSIGFPPKAITLFRRAETEYILSWIPFGGYVKMKGENPEEATGAEDELASKPAWQRFIVFFAGVAMNFALGFALYFFIFAYVGFSTSESVIDVTPQSVAEQAGLVSGDRVVAIDGQPVADWHDLTKIVSTKLDQPMTFKVERGDQVVSIVYQPEKNDSTNRYSLGFEPRTPAVVGRIITGKPAQKAGMRPGDRIIQIEDEPVESWREMVEIIHGSPKVPLEITWVRGDQMMSATITPISQLAPANEDGTETKQIGLIGISPPTITKKLPVGEAFKVATAEFVGVSTMIYKFLGMLVTGKVGADNVGGPILIFQAAGDSARYGLFELLRFMALLSINLAILNLLPIPALDGGHLLILLIESVIRRPLSVQSKVFWQTVGFVALIMLMIFATFNDIMRSFFS